ncbi:hypothetical protein Lsed01_00862 [Demequina sediminis]|uniref:Ferredoxin n=1 Tax=Demequina sediminis TaxID=1930058 RepID=A0ABP9WF62_9MICO|nr:hypothetical protein [Demequina sediminis]BDZ62484.1 hypothetical protein GCM10025873_22750 [Demequina sediminis]
MTTHHVRPPDADTTDSTPSDAFAAMLETWNARAFQEERLDEVITFVVNGSGDNFPDVDCMLTTGGCPTCNALTLAHERLEALATAEAMIAAAFLSEGADDASTDTATDSEPEECVVCEDEALERALGGTDAACICDPAETAPCDPACPVC